MGDFMRHFKYLSIYEDVKRSILDGTYKVHSKIPSKRKLASFYNVSVMTVDTAYQQLIAEGYLTSFERKAFYVNDIPEHRFFKQSTNRSETNLTQIEEDISPNLNKQIYFPHQVWAKLSRKVLSDTPQFMESSVDPQGHMDLRYEIKKYLEIYRGIITSVDHIVIGSGSQAMMQVLIALIGRDYTFVMEEPGFPRLKNILRYSGIKLITIPLDSQGINANQCQSKKPTVIHVTPSHQYPTGIVMPVARRIELLNWANQEEHRYIIEDDYDSEFRYQGQPIPAMQSLDRNSKVIYMNTFSKSLSPAIKINYLVLPQSLIEKYQEIKQIMPCSVPLFEQKVLAEFMRDHHFERHLNRVKKIYRRKALMVLEKLKDEKNIKITGYEAGLHMILKMDTAIDIKHLLEHIGLHHIKLIHLESFYDKKPEVCSDFMFEYSTLDDLEVMKTIETLLKMIHQSKNTHFGS